MPKKLFSDAEIRRLLEEIHGGKVDPDNLPEDVYYAIADRLKNGLYQGFGKTLNQAIELAKKGAKSVWAQSDLELLQELRENIYMFSAAKTAATVRDMTDALTDEKGNIRTFREFKEVADGIAETQFGSWLEAEYDTAIGQAQNAVRWQN